jgi:hypothetical protein
MRPRCGKVEIALAAKISVALNRRSAILMRQQPELVRLLQKMSQLSDDDASAVQNRRSAQAKSLHLM